MGSKTNVDAGDLRHWVTLLRHDNPTTPNAVGQVKPLYGPLGSYYALVECIGGAEAPNGDQLKGTLLYQVTLRAEAGPIYPSDQILWDGLALNVTRAVTDPLAIFIVVDATFKGQQ
jgi:hypothetical protein